MKTIFVLFAIIGMAIGMEGCAGIQKVGDLFATVDKLNAECHIGVTKLGMKGVNVITIAQCDAAAAKAKADIQMLVDKVRAELVKAGV